MEHRKRVKVVLGQRPESRIKQAVLILAVAFLVLGVSDFLGFNSLERKYPRQKKGKAVLSSDTSKSSRVLNYEDYLRQDNNRQKKEMQRQRLLNRSFYLTLVGVIFFVITVLLF